MRFAISIVPLLVAASASAGDSHAPALGGGTTRPVSGPDAFSMPAANMKNEHRRAFAFGNRLFNTNWIEAPASVSSFDGLGPLFNRVSCDGCHTKDGRGQPPENGHGPMDSMLFRLTSQAYGEQLNERAVPGTIPEGLARITYAEQTGLFTDGTAYSLRQPHYSVDHLSHGPLPQGTAISARVAPHMIGLGLLEAVADQDIISRADPEDTNADGISGRPNLVAGSIGRFGWKASKATLREQNAAAALGDIGLTTPDKPEQNCPAGQSACDPYSSSPEISEAFMAKLTLYTALLAVPAQRNADDPLVRRGEKLFTDFQCAACHTPMQQTSTNAALPEVQNQTFRPFTDLLLHDMGEGLADNRPEESATGNEWRTPPLWGLGLVPTVNGHSTLLHDGRARNFEEAILWHSGEAAQSAKNFSTASENDRQALIAFLKSL